MKANVLHGIGDLRFEEVRKPVLKEDEVLVNVRAAGICGSDVARCFVNGTYHFPTIIGHEFSGEVVDVYSSQDVNLIGKRFSIFPLLPCFQCSNCQSGHYECCTNYNYLGSRCDGGFAEYVAVPKWNLLPIPNEVSFEEAAMLEPTCVAYHTLRRAGTLKGTKVAIIGPGTIGMVLCRMASILGAEKVVLFGRSDVKLQFAKKHGYVMDICNLTSADVNKFVKNITDGHYFDLTIEGTGATQSLDYALSITRAFGNIIAMGNPVADIALSKQTYWKLLRKQLSLLGTWNSSYGCAGDDWQAVLDLIKQKKLFLEPIITHRFPLAELSKGLEIMRNNSEYYNKIMITNE